jgi:hypothetical protein
VRFEGVVQRFDEEEDLYWALYVDGDSEETTADEVRDAIHNYRVHLQQEEFADKTEVDAASRVRHSLVLTLIRLSHHNYW